MVLDHECIVYGLTAFSASQSAMPLHPSQSLAGGGIVVIPSSGAKEPGAS